MTQYQATIDGSTAYSVLTWNANWTLESLSTLDPTNPQIWIATLTSGTVQPIRPALWALDATAYQFVNGCLYVSRQHPDIPYRL
jgi:hypothetical protein